MSDTVDIKKIQVTPFNSANAEEWDSFVRNKARNGGLFHERKFLGYHPEGKFNDASLMFYEDKELVGVFPAAYVEKDGAKNIVSHPGSSNGGLVYENTSNLDTVLSMLEGLILYYKDQGVRSIEMKIAEPIFNKLPDGELTYLLWHRGFRMISQEISTCVLVAENKSWEAFCRKRNLSYIRKLEREGVTVEETEDLNIVYPVIESNLGARYGKKPTHTKEELSLLKSLYPDRIHYWIAKKGTDILGTIVLFDVNNHCVHDFYIAKNEELGDTKVMPLLFHKVMEHYHGRGFTWFNFGISSRGQQIKWGILEAKETIGGRATARQVWGMDDISTYQPYQRE